MKSKDTTRETIHKARRMSWTGEDWRSVLLAGHRPSKHGLHLILASYCGRVKNRVTWDSNLGHATLQPNGSTS